MKKIITDINNLSYFIQEAIKQHERYSENLGKPVQYWIDKNRNLCVEYSTGFWFHYRQTGTGWEWW